MGISNKVMKLGEYDLSDQYSVWYRIACGCMYEEHDCTITIKQDFEWRQDIDLVFYKKVSWADYHGRNDNFISRWVSRIKCSLKVLFTGYIELEEDFLIHGEEHIDNFIQALEEGKQKIKENI